MMTRSVAVPVMACLMLAALAGCETAAPVSQKPGAIPTANRTAGAPFYGHTPYGMPGQPAVPSTTPPTVSSGPVGMAGMNAAPPVAVPQGKLKAAILLPLSGANATLGQAMLNAAQQAVFDAAGNAFELQPHDTAANGGAEAAAHAALADGANIIIGPLFAADVPAVARVAQMAGIPVLALSTDTTLAAPGLYVMGLAPALQVARVVDFAAAHGVSRYAALLPATPYGTLVGQALQDAVARDGGQTVDVETFVPGAPGLVERVRQLVAAQGSYDALFLPEADSNLKIIADALAADGVMPGRPRLLGTGLWDVPGLAQQSAVLVGGWYAAPDPAGRRNFVAGYQAAYGAEPPRLATLAYDATALVAVLAKRGEGVSPQALDNPNGFAGVDGAFRLLPSGQVERALAVNEVTPAGPRVVDAAPATFMRR